MLWKHHLILQQWQSASWEHPGSGCCAALLSLQCWDAAERCIFALNSLLWRWAPTALSTERSPWGPDSSLNNQLGGLTCPPSAREEPQQRAGRSLQPGWESSASMPEWAQCSISSSVRNCVFLGRSICTCKWQFDFLNTTNNQRDKNKNIILWLTVFNHLSDAPKCPFKSVKRKKCFQCVILLICHLEQI